MDKSKHSKQGENDGEDAGFGFGRNFDKQREEIDREDEKEAIEGDG